VFVRHALPKGEMRHRGRRVDLGAIRRLGLMTVEGERDDITGFGQCGAAQALCRGVPERNKLHFVCPGVGHYGIFNGSRFQTEIAPRIADFVRRFDPRTRRRAHIYRVGGNAGAHVRHHGHEMEAAAFTFAPGSDAGVIPLAH
jgi:poly(3-hydroxybutyrate) depolymerase